MHLSENHAHQGPGDGAGGDHPLDTSSKSKDDYMDGKILGYSILLYIIQNRSFCMHGSNEFQFGLVHQ